MPTSERGWWELERARLVRERVDALAPPGALVVDVGCGRGAMLVVGTDRSRIVVNVDSHRWENWVPQPKVHYVVAAADALPFRDDAFDIVGSFDVLEHLANDEAALSEQARIVRRDGHVVTAVPADPRLWSVHDEAVGHCRRYSRTSFLQVAGRAGLATTRATCFFGFLWLPAVLTRRRPQRQSEPGTGSGFGSALVRAGVHAWCRVERWFLRRWSLPIGTSLWFEASKARR